MEPGARRHRGRLTSPQGETCEYQDGLLTLQGGRSFALEGTSKFNVASSLSSLKLQTADKGIKIQLKKVLLDDAASPPAVVGGDLAYKILGQSGKAEVPAPAP